ncbi:hypothetical protein ASPCADRAFT_504261, partial [Aspergillus carbonarius ITEM 5010]
MEDDTRNMGTFSFFPGDFSGHRRQRLQSTYLMPVGLHDAASQYTASSISSPVSPARSMSPFEGNLQPDLGYLAGDNRNDFAGISGGFGDGIQALPLPASSNPITILIPPDDLHVNNLKAALAQVTIALEEIASQQGTARLYEVKDLLKANYNRHIAMIQHQIDTAEHSSHSPVSSVSHDSMPNTVRYTCYLCPREERKIYQGRGSFKRHVSYRHRPQAIYRCLGNNCPWISARRDKVHCHMRTHHSYQFRVTQEQLHLLETKLPSPDGCELCRKPVSCWAEYFKCVSEHCRIGNNSTSTSATQSRRGSDDRGGGGNDGHGYNGHHFPGNGSGANGLQPFFPSGSGNNGGSSPPAGQNYGFYGNRLSKCVNTTNHLDNETISSESSGGTEAGLASDSGSASSTSDVSHEIVSNGPSSLISQHLSRMRRTHPVRHRRCDSVQHGDNCAPSYPHKPASRRLSDDARLCIPRSSSTFDTTPRPDPHPVTNGSSKRRCQGCGHILDDCNKCQPMKGTVLKCHMCAEIACKTHDRREVAQSRNCDQTVDGSKLYVSERSVSDDTRPLPLTNQSGGSSGHSSDINYAIHGDQSHSGTIATSNYNSHENGLSESHMHKTPSIDSLGSLCPGSRATSASLVGHDAVAHSVAAKSETLDPQGFGCLLGETTRQEAQVTVHDHGHVDLLGTKKLVQAYSMQSFMKLQHKSYSVLLLSVLTLVGDLLNQWHICWLIYEASIFHSTLFSCQISQKGVLTKKTESAISRHFLCYPAENLRHISPARRMSRKRHAKLRAKLHVIVELIKLHAATTRKNHSMSSSLVNFLESEHTETRDINTKLQLADPDFQGPRYLQVMFTRGTEVVGDVLSNLITDVVFATEEELDLIKPVSAYL